MRPDPLLDRMRVGSSVLRIAVLATGEGTTLQTIAKGCSAGKLGAEIAVVICNNRDSGALRRASELSLPLAHLSAVTEVRWSRDVRKPST